MRRRTSRLKSRTKPPEQLPHHPSDDAGDVAERFELSAAVFPHVPPAADLDHEARDAAIPAVVLRRHERPGVRAVHRHGQTGGGESVDRERRDPIRGVERVGADADVGPVGGLIPAKGRERSPTSRAGRRRLTSWSLSKLRAQRIRERTIGWPKPAITPAPALTH